MAGLYNRRYWFNLADKQLKQAVRYNHSLAVIMLDIDHFKQVNDAYGHSVGDEVLVTVVRSLADSFRTVDVLARFGGEEFVILLPQTYLPAAQNVTERLREKLASLQIETRKASLSLTISL